MPQTLTGTIRFWNTEKAWGFVTSADEGGDDVYVHISGFECHIDNDLMRVGLRVAYQTKFDANGRRRCCNVAFTDQNNADEIAAITRDGRKVMRASPQWATRKPAPYPHVERVEHDDGLAFTKRKREDKWANKGDDHGY